MIKLVFTFNRETLQFLVENKIVSYTDRKWKGFIQVIPEDKEFIKKAIMARNKVPIKIIHALIIDANKGENFKEWQNAKNDNEVAEIIIRDCAKQGIRLSKRFD